MASMSQLTMAMITLYSGDPKRIQHFMKVYAFAKMIAEELHKFIRNDVRKAVTEMATAETEEYLNAKQAAVFLGWKLQTLYNRIHDIPHTKNGKSLIFTKSALRKFMERK